MGKKDRYIIIVLLILNMTLRVQAQKDFQSVDSATYKYYLEGKWNLLIDSGTQLINNGYDYKYLRQRLGYAYFITGDYIRAAGNLEKALRFDSFDPFTLAYLHYTNKYLLKPESAGYFASQISPESRNAYGIKPATMAEIVDFEVSMKIPSASLRANPWYYRFGLGSRPFYRLGIYQSISGFSQNITLSYPGYYDRFITRQFEYFALAKYGMTSKLGVQAAYHYMYTDYETSSFSTNIGYAGLTYDLYVINVQADASLTRNIWGNYFQTGLKTGFRIPGDESIFLKGGVSLMRNKGINELIYSARAGFRAGRDLYLEADFSTGNMNYFNDFDALYVYNSIDPLKMKGGLTADLLISDHITLWIHAGSESKRYYENESYSYNQFTLLGGLRWRH